MQQLLFECEPVYSNWISGFVSGLRDARVQVKYSARWVQEFLALSDRIVTFVPVAEATTTLTRDVSAFQSHIFQAIDPARFSFGLQIRRAARYSRTDACGSFGPGARFL